MGSTLKTGFLIERLPDSKKPFQNLNWKGFKEMHQIFTQACFLLLSTIRSPMISSRKPLAKVG